MGYEDILILKENITDSLRRIDRLSAEFDTKIIIRKQDRIDYLLNGICSYYNITLKDLQRRHNDNFYAPIKRMAIKILYDIADIKFTEIALLLSDGRINKPNAAWMNYSKLTDKLDKNYNGDGEVKKEYAKLLKYLKL
jgi:hypothetical protein